VNPATRAMVGLVIQGGCLALAIYVLVSDGAFPGASMIARVGIAILSLAVAMTYAEVTQQRAHLQAVLMALQARVGASVPRDDRRAIDTLVAALSTGDAAARETAHRHLVRLTGKDLPADAARWEAWWSDARADFPTSGSADGG
jgi:hypothetical protein